MFNANLEDNPLERRQTCHYVRTSGKGSSENRTRRVGVRAWWHDSNKLWVRPLAVRKVHVVAWDWDLGNASLANRQTAVRSRPRWRDRKERNYSATRGQEGWNVWWELCRLKSQGWVECRSLCSRLYVRGKMCSLVMNGFCGVRSRFSAEEIAESEGGGEVVELEEIRSTSLIIRTGYPVTIQIYTRQRYFRLTSLKWKVVQLAPVHS